MTTLTLGAPRRKPRHESRHESRRESRLDAIAADLETARQAAARALVAPRASRTPVPKHALHYLLARLGSVQAVAAATTLDARTIRTLARPHTATCNPATAELLTQAAARVAAGTWVPAPRDDVRTDVEGSEPARLRKPQLVAIETEHLLPLGESPEQIAARLGLKLDSLLTNLRRAGRHDLVERVSRIRSAGRAVDAP